MNKEKLFRQRAKRKKSFADKDQPNCKASHKRRPKHLKNCKAKLHNSAGPLF